MNKNHYILTGAIGAGKTTVLKALNKLGYLTIPEPAREIIAEQREIDGEGVYDRDPKLFYYLMLSRAIFQYQQSLNASTPIIFDRGIADNIAYGKLFNLDTLAAENAAKLYRYHTKVFFLPAWEAIYTTDNDRQLSFEEAKHFGEQLKQIYLELDYDLIEVPCIKPHLRADFITNVLRG